MRQGTLASPTGYSNLTQWSVYIATASYPDYILALAAA